MFARTLRQLLHLVSCGRCPVGAASLSLALHAVHNGTCTTMHALRLTMPSQTELLKGHAQLSTPHAVYEIDLMLNQ